MPVNIGGFINFFYYGSMFLFAGIFLLLALTLPKKSKEIKAIFFIAFIGVFVIYLWIIPSSIKSSLKEQEEKERPIKEERERKYQTAKAVFDEQCKKAGEKIYRTVDNVDGIMLLKLQGEKEIQRYDPMWEDAAIGVNILYPDTIEEYIENFLSYDVDYNTIEQKYHYWTNGYKYVDVLKINNSINEQHNVTRYTREIPTKKSKLKKEFQIVNPARYAVTYENNIDPELRKYWVAGTTIKIIDRQTDELLAEKTIFAFDPFQGATSDRGAPWSHRANICLSEKEIEEPRDNTLSISNFTFTILTPKPLFMETQNER